MNILDIISSANTSILGFKLRRLVNNLQWRQSYLHSDVYPLELESGRVLMINQIMNGETSGVGTGANVWPAAHVLVKYLENRYKIPKKMKGIRVCDLGCGTGVVGLAAAALGADVVLTDLDCVLPLAEVNVKSCMNQKNDIEPGSASIISFDWGRPADILHPPFDVILVSDCILPKLYPIEPLVKAVSSLMDHHSIAFFSYEHRIYPYFDPRQEFRRLAHSYGLEVETVPISLHHEIYCSDEIEIWEVRRARAPAPSAMTQSPLESPQVATDFDQRGSRGPHIADSRRVSGGLNGVSDTDVRVLSWRGQSGPVVVRLGDSEVVIEQQCDARAAAVGGYLWSSSFALCRFIFREDLFSSSSLPQALRVGVSPTAHKRAIELGAGCGLVSIALHKMGYSVTATDRETALPLLRKNVTKYLESSCSPSSSRGDEPVVAVPNTIEVEELDWMHPDRLYPSDVSDDGKWDLVVMSDCLYCSSSIDPLLTVLDQVAGPRALLLLANELRTSLDTFLNRIRTGRRPWIVESLEISHLGVLDDFIGEESVHMSGPSQVALGYRL